MLGNNIYFPGDSTDIGEQQLNNRPDPGSTLVCVTTNVNTACCRSGDNTNGGALGDFIGPDELEKHLAIPTSPFFIY